jgi:hypothetical protein
MTFFSSRVMPRLAPAVDAIAIELSSRETLVLDAARHLSVFSSERGLMTAIPEKMTESSRQRQRVFGIMTLVLGALRDEVERAAKPVSP